MASRSTFQMAGKLAVGADFAEALAIEAGQLPEGVLLRGTEARPGNINHEWILAVAGAARGRVGL